MAEKEINVGQLRKIRLDKIEKLRETGVEPFGQRFERDTRCAEITENFDELEGKTVRIAGRIMAKRRQGKAGFCNIKDLSGNMQLYIRKDDVGEDKYEWFKTMDVGDIFGIEGTVFRTQKGEITVHVYDMVYLSKSINPLPEKWHGLKDVDTRYRKRYVDLIVNPEVCQNFILRSKFIKHLRSYLDNQGFIEVETPVLSTIAGGAAARPFITHHNTLNIDLYMRIATELPLKRLIIGGMERVYEVGSIFRN